MYYPALLAIVWLLTLHFPAFAGPPRPALLREITVCEGPIDDIAFLPNGKEFVCVASLINPYLGDPTRGPLRFVDIEKGIAVLVKEVPAPHGASLLAVSPDGRWLATGRRHATTKASDLLLWDLEKGGCKILVGHTGDLHPFHFSPDSKRLASSGGDRVVRIWDVRTGHCIELRRAYEHFEFPGTPVFLSNDRVAVGSSGGHKVTLWGITERKVLDRFGPAVTQWDSWHATAARSDGKMLALTGHTGKVTLWEHEKFTTLAGHEHGYAIRFQPNSHLLATAYETKVRLWDSRTRTKVAEVDLPEGTQTPCLAFSQKGNLLLCGAIHGKVRLYDVSALRIPLR